MKIAGIHLSNIKQLAASKRKRFQTVAKKLKSKSSQKVDEVINTKHHELFENIDCLDCANCCKTTSPIILQSDIQRISKYLKISASQFMKQYINMDEDGDFVVNSSPCPFLEDDNRCSIYDVRPKACSQYPHTQQRKQTKLLNLAIENTAICPAVYQIFEYLEEANNE